MIIIININYMRPRRGVTWRNIFKRLSRLFKLCSHNSGVELKGARGPGMPHNLHKLMQIMIFLCICKIFNYRILLRLNICFVKIIIIQLNSRHPNSISDSA
jgi:hypothetical protein